MYQFALRNPQLIQRNLMCRWLINRSGPVVSKQRMDHLVTTCCAEKPKIPILLMVGLI
jgi:hypothetical protein